MVVKEEQVIEEGQRWRYDATNPHLIGDSRYGPMWLYVTVVWDDGENVHYRSDSSPNKVDQTPRSRFLEVAELVPQEEILSVQKEYSFSECYLLDFKLDHHRQKK